MLPLNWLMHGRCAHAGGGLLITPPGTSDWRGSIQALVGRLLPFKVAGGISSSFSSSTERMDDELFLSSGTAMRLHELFNITDEDLDYYLNYTVLLHSPTVGQTDLEDLEGTSQIGVELVGDDYAGCGLGLHKIRRSVHLIHGFLSLFICLAGCLANVVNILVLSRRELRRTAINRILCSLAVADFLLMLEYIPFACHMYLFPGRSLESFYSYSWAVFVLFHAHFTLVAHTVSIWLTLSLAFWRYEVLKNGRHHQRRKSGRRCHQERCTRTIIMAYVGSIVLCIPSFVLFGIEQQQVTISSNSLGNQSLGGQPDEAGLGLYNNVSIFLYKVNLNPIAKNYDGLIHKAHLWAYSVVMKLGPCLVLTVLTCWLVRRLWEAERHHQSLTAKLSSQDPSRPSEAGTSSRTMLQHDFQSHPVSLTQQLEMRQLNSAMNRAEAGVHQIPIIVTDGDQDRPDMEEPLMEQQQDTAGSTRASSTSLKVSVRKRQSSIMECSSMFTVDPVTTTRMETIVVADDGLTAVGTGHSPASRRRSQLAALNRTKSLRHKHQTDRTTRMLVAVLLLFLITEIPQGVMALLSGILGRQFFTRCYSTGMGEILDLLALLNSAINFLLYCSMSRQFRRAARSQFRKMGRSVVSSIAGPCCSSGGDEEDEAGENNNPGTPPQELQHPPHCCFHFRAKFRAEHQLPAANISPSNPTRCTQL